jgi:hypothetical protein
MRAEIIKILAVGFHNIYQSHCSRHAILAFPREKFNGPWNGSLDDFLL